MIRPVDTPGVTYVPPRPAWVPVPPQPHRRGLPTWATALIVLGGAAVLLLVAAAALIALGSRSPAPYYSVTSCQSVDGVTSMGFIVRDNDKVPHDYTVHGSIGHSPAVPDVLVGVAPGQTVTGHLEGFESTGDCRITEVDQR